MILALAACQHDDPVEDTDFAADFRFGTATAGFQVETGCPTWSDAQCPTPPSDWATFVSDPQFVGNSGMYLSGDPLSDGPGMWETFEDDVTRMKGVVSVPQSSSPGPPARLSSSAWRNEVAFG